MQNLRKDPRVSIQLAAEITLPNLVALECRVRDLSRGGALLAMEDVTRLPAQFGLRLATSNTVRQVAVRWMRQGEVGVRFV